ncbi:MAG: alkaline phosphatase family protein [Planctomycetaceae bacterium]|nr:alkaline phosphatase family protein [Planctomycetaceae bacterium]
MAHELVKSLLGILLFALLFTSSAAAQELDPQQPLQRILFGSCIKQEQPLPIVDAMLREQPQLLLMLGDNIYADTADMAVMQAKYETLAQHPEFRRLKAACPILATWDDHDYGLNDGGADFPKRDAAQRLFVDFWGDRADSPRRTRPGVYEAHIYGPPGQRVQIILLDTRYFRSPLKQGERRVGGPYVPDNDPTKTMLGEAQWAWLAEQLKTPAEFRLIGTSIQFAASDAGQETWSNFPREQQRLVELIASTKANGVVLLSGDRHWAELSAWEDAAPYPLYDLTSSSLNQLHRRGTPTENTRRVDERTWHQENYGLVTINWAPGDPVLTMSVRDMQGATRIEKTIRFSELRSNR